MNGEHHLLGFLDDSVTPGDRIMNVRVVGSVANLPTFDSGATKVFIAIGNNRVRQELSARATRLGFTLPTLVHPRALVSPSATIGAGSAVMAGAIVGAEATVGAGVILNIGAAVDHHCVVHDFGHLGVGACMAGGAVLGHGAWMQAASALGYGVKVGEWDVLRPAEGRVAAPADVPLSSPGEA